MAGELYENLTGERFVHMASVDRPDHGSVYEELWSLATGNPIRIAMSSLKKMKSLGADMDLRPLKSLDAFQNYAEKSDLEFLRPHIDYFVALIEGHEPLKNWYEWFSENQTDLASHLTRMDFLRLKGHQKGIFLLQILNRNGIYPRPISPRYFWLLGRLP